jgi:ribosomal protein S18 acetylase RimI-like enzyme
MTALVPMQADGFDAFAEESIASYAQDNTRACRWSPADALDRARKEFQHLLPQGLQTPENFIYDIRDEVTHETVGFVWFAIVQRAAIRSAYVYSIRIKPEFRGRGHAKAALDLVEGIATAAGLSTIALHVFSFNTGAQALYRSLGYGITGFNMLKPLQPRAS